MVTMSGRASAKAVLTVAVACAVVIAVTLTADIVYVGVVVVVILSTSLVLRTEVTFAPDAVDIRLRPLFHRRIPAGSVSSVRARTIAPLREFGGWGVRKKRGLTALVLGFEAIEIELTDGYRYVVSVSEHDADRLSTLGYP
jgi:hypothetical protein